MAHFLLLVVIVFDLLHDHFAVRPNVQESQDRSSAFFTEIGPSSRDSTAPLLDATEPKRAYVTFIQGKNAIENAMVLTKSMQMLNHSYPNLLMVREDSEMRFKLPAVQKAMRKHGWRADLMTFKPETIRAACVGLPARTNCAGPNWREAWQRMSVYKLGSESYDRFAHLDADMLVFRNIDHILDNSTMPTFARRMRGCSSLQTSDSLRPVTNFFVDSPDDKVFGKLAAYVKDDDNSERLLDDGTVIPSVRDYYAVLHPEQVFYYDCLTHFADTEWRGHKPELPDDVHALHLGYPGRLDLWQVRKSKDKFDSVVKEAHDKGQNFRARALQHWMDGFHSEDVQDVMKAWFD